MTRPIKERLRMVIGNKPSMCYHDMMERVFPIDDFPNAWQSATRGGPPGCARAFGAALNRYGYSTIWRDKRRIVCSPSIQQKP